MESDQLDQAVTPVPALVADEGNNVAVPVDESMSRDHALTQSNETSNVVGSQPIVESVSVNIEEERRKIREELSMLRDRMLQIATSNRFAAPADKLDYQSLLIDGTTVPSKSVETECLAIEAEVKHQNIVKDIQKTRIIESFYKSTKVPAKSISSLSTNLAVFNYPVPLTDPSIEVKDIIASRSPHTSLEASYVANQPGQRFIFSTQSPSELPPSDIERVLLEPHKVLTAEDREIQGKLLFALQEQYRTEFNAEFQVVEREKQQVLEKVNDKLKRIRAIATELGRVDIDPQDLPEPCKPHSLENPQLLLKVDDSELTNPEVFTPEELALQEAERQRAQDRIVRFETSEIMVALKDMMGGNVKSKRELTPLEKTCEREPWMDEVTQEQWTEEQRTMFFDFQAREKQQSAERIKYIEKLNTEWLDLKKQVLSMYSDFEATLLRLEHSRSHADRRILAQQLLCLAYDKKALAEQQSEANVLAQVKHLQDLEIATEECRARVSTAVASMAALKTAKEGIIAELKVLAGKFKHFLQASPLAVSTHPALTLIFKNSNPASLKKQEIPLGVDPESYAAVCELRDERKKLTRAEAEIEEDIKRQEGELTELHAAVEKAVAAEVSGKRAIDDAKLAVEMEKANCPVMLHLPLEKIEVTQQPVITDYSSAKLVCVSRDLVPVNDQVRSIGQAKLGVISDIHRFRQLVSVADWELERLALHANDARETSKDLHLARVHRDVKKILSDSVKTDDKELSNLSQLQDHAKRVAEVKIKRLRKQLASIKQAIAHKEEENKTFAARVEELAKENASKDTMSEESLLAIEEGTRQGQKKLIVAGGGKIAVNPLQVEQDRLVFESLKKKTSLRNLVRNQQEALEKMITELDRLRRRSFPIFDN